MLNVLLNCPELICYIVSYVLFVGVVWIAAVLTRDTQTSDNPHRPSKPTRTMPGHQSVAEENIQTHSPSSARKERAAHRSTPNSPPDGDDWRAGCAAVFTGLVWAFVVYSGRVMLSLYSRGWALDDRVMLMVYLPSVTLLPLLGLGALIFGVKLLCHPKIHRRTEESHLAIASVVTGSITSLWLIVALFPICWMK